MEAFATGLPMVGKSSQVNVGACNLSLVTDSVVSVGP